MSGRTSVVLLTASAMLSILLAAQIVDFGFGRDQGIYAAVARTVRHGGLPYRDAWDFKPPAIYYVYAIAGARPVAIRILEVAALLAAVPAIVMLSERWVGSREAAALPVLLAFLIQAQSEFWDTAQPETFGAVLVLWAIALAAWPPPGQPAARVPRWVTVGFLYGAAGCFKPTLGIAGLGTLAVGIVLARRHGRPMAPVRLTLAFAGGGLLSILVCLTPFILQGGVADLLRTLFGFAPHYTGVAVLGVWPSIARVLTDWLWTFSVVNLVGLVLLALPLGGASRGDMFVHLAPVIALLLAGTALQQKFFLYHYTPALYLSAVAAGWGYWILWCRLGRRNAVLPLLLAVLLLLAAARPRLVPTSDPFFTRVELRARSWVDPANRVAIRDRLYSLYDYSRRDNRLAAEWIRTATTPDAPLFVWGFTPELYLLAERPLASRFIYDVPARAPWSMQITRAEIISALSAARPGAIVVEHGDSVPQVTGTLGDSALDAFQFDDFRQFVAAGYELRYRNRKFDVYVRRP